MRATCKHGEPLISRRNFVGALLAGASTMRWSWAASAQQSAKPVRIGWLASAGAAGATTAPESFRAELRQLGYVEGQNLAIEFRAGGGDYGSLSGFAAELVALPVDIIVTTGVPAALAAKQATSTIPIVAASVGDPIGAGLVTNLARPGGNLTGISHFAADLSGKQIELFKEAMPKLVSVALLYNPTNPLHSEYYEETDAVARKLGVTLFRIDAEDVASLDRAMQSIHGANGLLILSDPLFVARRRRILELAAEARLPVVGPYREFADVGGLLAYGPSLPEISKRAAVYVDKILKGTKPGDLPVEQPVRFELVINLRTAKTLGLALPQSLLLRADEVIE